MLDNNASRMRDHGKNARDLAKQSLAFLRLGRVEDGLPIYQRALREPEGTKLPLGLHAAMLRQEGQIPAAACIEALGLVAGADISFSTCLPNADPAKIAAEYRERFERGQINATMVSRYLTRLAQAGDTHAMEPWTDPALVRCVDLDLASGGTIRADKLADVVRGRLRPHHWRESSQSIAKSATFEFEVDGEPLVQQLFDGIRDAVFAYADNADYLVTGDKGWVPESFATRCWAVVSNGDGFNHRHIHPQAWLTAVYYAAFPNQIADPDAGCLRLGPPEAVADDAAGWLHRSIRPRPGLLVLFPSWMTHWTTPLGVEGERISLPMDVNDLSFRTTGYKGGLTWHRKPEMAEAFA